MTIPVSVNGDSGCTETLTFMAQVWLSDVRSCKLGIACMNDCRKEEELEAPVQLFLCTYLMRPAH